MTMTIVISVHALQEPGGRRGVLERGVHEAVVPRVVLLCGSPAGPAATEALPQGPQ